MLPQVSSRSRKSLEEVTGSSAYGSGEHRDSRQVKIGGNLSSGLNQSPSVMSLHGEPKNGGLNI